MTTGLLLQQPVHIQMVPIMISLNGELNRLGESFKSLISEPKVIRQDCDFRLVSGQNTLINNLGTAVITYGLDAEGNPTGCPGSGTYYYKLVWTGVNGKTLYCYPALLIRTFFSKNPFRARRGFFVAY